MAFTESLEPQPFDVASHHDPDPFARKPYGQHLIVAVHHPKQRARFDAGCGAPGFQSPERTTGLLRSLRDADPPSLPFLVGFGFPNRHDQSVASFLRHSRARRFLPRHTPCKTETVATGAAAVGQLGLPPAVTGDLRAINQEALNRRDHPRRYLIGGNWRRHTCE
jgi:hypothetical protein